MNSQESKLDFQEFFLSLLGRLSEREQAVLKKRYQLVSNLSEKSTLKEIGDDYNITRERVRQIERESIEKLVEAAKQAEHQEKIEQIKNSIIQYLERKGGVVLEDDLVKEHALVHYDFDTLHLNSFLFTLNHLIEDLDRREESESFYSFWQLNHLSFDGIFSFIEKVTKMIESHNAVMPEKELLEQIEHEALSEAERESFNEFKDKHQDLHIQNFIGSYLTITKRVEKNILNHWGLAHWADVRPKKLADKIFLIYKSFNKPLHFREVAQQINGAGFDQKKICPATVHNELIANKNYVLIGRGIYAPKDWGYVAGTVADVVAEILRRTNKPLSKEAIYEAVLKQRQVNPSTIYLALINKKRFEKTADGLYQLAV